MWDAAVGSQLDRRNGVTGAMVRGYFSLRGLANSLSVKDAGFGPRPTAQTGHSLVDAFVWVKPGGEVSLMQTLRYTPDIADIPSLTVLRTLLPHATTLPAERRLPSSRLPRPVRGSTRTSRCFSRTQTPLSHRLEHR